MDDTSIIEKIVINALIERNTRETKVIKVLFLKPIRKFLAKMLSNVFLKCMIEI